ncbi:MAG: inorganic phosphate transporter [Desulfobacteraceae bacterium]|jgi:PiT family inorganic phosphate transporter
MELAIALTLLITGFYVGWNIGANDAANCIGTTVGARIISFRKAALLMAACVILGGVVHGHHVMKTVGKGIVISSAEAYENAHNKPPPRKFAQFFPDEKLPDLAIFVALFSAGLFVTLATFSSIPVSTSQAIVGGVAGAGLGIVGFQANYFKLNILAKIFACWVISPILTMVLAFGLYSGITYVLKGTRAIYIWNRLLVLLAIGSGGYVAYSLGANDVGNAIGPLLNKYPDKGIYLALLGGVAMGTGALTYGRKVTNTVGKSITPLDLPGAFSAQFAAAFGVHIFSVLGIPVSTSQAVVGAVIGVGLTKGARAVSRNKITTIVVGWVLAPTCAAAFASVLYRIIRCFFEG